MAVLSRSRFYLLVSDYEGMSMSTIEAVQAGCVAVVRPVGEIGHYLDRASAIFVEDVSPEGIQRAAEAVCALWNDSEDAATLSARARAALSRVPHYVDALSRVLQLRASPE
jgi:hypothetical protein